MFNCQCINPEVAVTTKPLTPEQAVELAGEDQATFIEEHPGQSFLVSRSCKLCGGLIQGGEIACPDCEPHLLHRALVCTIPGCECRWDREFGRRVDAHE